MVVSTRVTWLDRENRTTAVYRSLAKGTNTGSGNGSSEHCHHQAPPKNGIQNWGRHTMRAQPGGAGGVSVGNTWHIAEEGWQVCLVDHNDGVDTDGAAWLRHRQIFLP